ncbi:MAG: hypothetical protein MJZ92_02195, partial [Paludibacteraceae bacterium]|nr:hypothetical protein [Paludibacteraceae bacterium]
MKRKSFLFLIAALCSVSLCATEPEELWEQVCTADHFAMGCNLFHRADGNQDTLIEISGKDVRLHLSWGKPSSSVITDSVLVGGHYLFGCDIVTLDGKKDSTFIRTEVNASGCDSLITLNLRAVYKHLRDTLTDTLKATLCYQEAYTDLQGVTYYPTQDTIIQDTILAARFDTVAPTITTIDSIYVHKLHVHKAPTPAPLENITLCYDETYTWLGHETRYPAPLAVADTYYDTLR